MQHLFKCELSEELQSLRCLKLRIIRILHVVQGCTDMGIDEGWHPNEPRINKCGNFVCMRADALL